MSERKLQLCEIPTDIKQLIVLRLFENYYNICLISKEFYKLARGEMNKRISALGSGTVVDMGIISFTCKVTDEVILIYILLKTGYITWTENTNTKEFTNIKFEYNTLELSTEFLKKVGHLINYLKDFHKIIIATPNWNSITPQTPIIHSIEPTVHAKLTIIYKIYFDLGIWKYGWVSYCPSKAIKWGAIYNINNHGVVYPGYPHDVTDISGNYQYLLSYLKDQLPEDIDQLDQ